VRRAPEHLVCPPGLCWRKYRADAC
jgi:hypothetical protein